jgi:putative polyketide hydroxylase
MPEPPIPVLIAGGGTVGLSAALFLAARGVPALVVERRAGISIHPRALGVGIRTIEIFRSLGLEDAVCTVGRRLTFGQGRISARTLASADWSSFYKLPAAEPGAIPSPTVGGAACSQDLLDEIVLGAACERGAEVRFGVEVVAVEQDAAGVTATVVEREGGAASQRTIRAEYLIVADGAGGGLRETLGVPVSGPGVLGPPIVNILFRADLRTIAQGHEITFAILNNEELNQGLLMSIDGRERWVLHVPFDPARESAEDFTPERCRDLVARVALGAPELPVEILSVLPWRVGARLADRFREGRIFLAGDAAHVMPPMGGFGMNTGIADAHNLAWKLARVLRGQAGPGLLDSYDAERRPVARFTMDQALLRLESPPLHWDPSRTAEREEKGIAADMVVHLGYRYGSPAPPSLFDLDRDLDGAPGSRVPHAWLEREGQRVSTLDLAGAGFALLAGPEGGDWCGAAAAVAERLEMDLPAFRIPDEAWCRAAGVGKRGALLVRPDGFVAWRAERQEGEEEDVLERVLREVG